MYIRFIISIFMFFCLSVADSHSSIFEGKGRTVFPFLKINPSVKSAGMAGANAVTLTGIDSVFLNPAGLAGIDKAELYAQYTSWIDAISVAHVALAKKSDLLSGVVCITASHVIYPSQNITEEDKTSVYNYRVLSQFEPSSSSAGIYYSRLITEKLSNGTGIKVLYRKLGDYTEDSAIALETGFRYAASPYVRYGISLNNISQGIQSGELLEPLPLMIRIGGEWRSMPVYRNFGKRDSQKVFSEVEYIFGLCTEMRFQEGIYLKGGFEIIPYNFISFKAGYDYPLESDELGGPGGLNMGFSLLNIMSMDIDYSIGSLGRLGFVHRAALKFSL